MISIKTSLTTLLVVGLSFDAFADHTFAPKGCEFEMRFPAPPVIQRYQSFEGIPCLTTAASITLAEDRTAIQAECTVCELHEHEHVGENELIGMLREHAEASGVQNAAFSYEQSYLGKVGVYRGQIPSIKNTIVVHAILGKRSSLNLRFSAPYTVYPKAYEQFEAVLNSVAVKR